MKPEAVIFDLDGTLIDNNSYHIEAWKVFYTQHGLEFSMDDYRNNINGKINADIFNYVLKTNLTAEDLEKYSNEKEKLYRELYAEDIRPIHGLLGFLDKLKDAGIMMAIATSGIPINIDFMFQHIMMREYFSAVVNATHISNGKPHPEIFLKAAMAANANPANCVAFEDSVAGIRSAKAAGMTVIALATTHKREELHEADLIIDDYTDVDISTLEKLMDRNS